MKKIIYLVIYSLVLFVILFIFACLSNSSSPINVYGSKDLIAINRNGLLTDFLEQSGDKHIESVIIENKNKDCLLISQEHFAQFSISNVLGKWVLNKGDKAGNSILKEITRIFLNTSSKDFGLYHLNHVQQKKFYCSYELIKSHITRVDSDSPYYERGIIKDSLQVYISDVEEESVLYVFNNGEEEYFELSDNGYLRIGEKLLFPKDSNSNRKILKAVWENQPALSAHIIHDLLMESLENKPTMAIFIDGLGYELWDYALENGYTNTFPQMDLKPMRVIYPPRTIYNYYMFGTGELLTNTNPLNREIFPLLKNSVIQGLIIEAKMQMFSSPLEQKLHHTLNTSDSMDELIFKSTMKYMNDYDFIFVHFHDIDNNGHYFGPYSNEVMKTILQTGYYVSELSNKWTGNIFLFSDHGMHEYYDSINNKIAGTHYTAKVEDIVGIFANLSNLNKGD